VYGIGDMVGNIWQVQRPAAAARYCYNIHVQPRA
jgi:hypothetical protein